MLRISVDDWIRLLPQFTRYVDGAPHIASIDESTGQAIIEPVGVTTEESSPVYIGLAPTDMGD